MIADTSSDSDPTDSGDNTSMTPDSDSSSTIDIDVKSSTVFIGGLVGAITALLAFILLTAAILATIVIVRKRRIKPLSSPPSQHVYSHRDRGRIHTRNNVAYFTAAHVAGEISTQDNVAYTTGYVTAASILVVANECYGTGTPQSATANQLYATPTVGGASNGPRQEDYDYVIPYL